MPPKTRAQLARAADVELQWIRISTSERFNARRAVRDEIPLGDIDRITLCYKFADWRFGEVYVCKNSNYHDEPQHFMRRFEKSKLDDGTRQQPMLERYFLSGLEYHLLPDMVERIKDGRNLFIVTRDIPFGCFNRLLPPNRGGRLIGEDEAKPYLHQVFNALAYLHNIGIMHRCVCLDHCLIFAHGRVKVFELTCATALQDRVELMGDERYAAPEMYNNEPYGRGVDWWAFGVLVHKLLLNEYPFDGNSYDQLKTAVLTEEPCGMKAPQMSRNFCDFIGLVLDKTSEHRHAFNDGVLSDAIRNHPWFKDSLSVEWILETYVNPTFDMDIWKGEEVDAEEFKYSPPETDEDLELYKLF